MQVSAISAQSFGKKEGKLTQFPGSSVAEVQSEELQKVVAKTQQDVKPLTIFTGLAILWVSFKKGKNIVPVGRKVGATAAEYAAKGATKLASLVTGAGAGIAKAITKKDVANPIKFEKVNQSIEKWALSACGTSEKACQPNEKITKKLPEAIGKHFGEKAQKQFENFINKNNIKNYKDVFDIAAATAVGVIMTDKATDKVESAQDKLEIQAAERKIRQSTGTLIKEAIGDLGGTLADLVEAAGEVA